MTNNKKVTYLYGLPGSGKSQWAKEHLDWDNCDAIVTLKTELNAIIADGAERIIFDDEIGSADVRMNAVREIAEANGYAFEVKPFYVSKADCINNLKNRGRANADEIVKKAYKEIGKTLTNMQISEAYDNQYGFNPLLPSAIIVDIDSTIAWNLSGRPFYGKGSADGMLNDKPNWNTISIVRMFMQTHRDSDDRVFFVTGRTDDTETRKVTEIWLHKHIPLNYQYELIMRAPKDFTPSVEFKKKVYMERIRDKYNVDFVMDDTDSIVNMFRSLGLCVLQPFKSV